VREIDIEFAGVCLPWRPAWLSFHDPALNICRYDSDKRLPVVDKLFDIFSIQGMRKNAETVSITDEEKSMCNIFSSNIFQNLNKLGRVNKFVRCINWLSSVIFISVPEWNAANFCY